MVLTMNIELIATLGFIYQHLPPPHPIISGVLVEFTDWSRLFMCLSTVRCESSNTRSSPGPGGAGEGREKCTACPQQPSGKQRDATGGWTLPYVSWALWQAAAGQNNTLAHKSQTLRMVQRSSSDIECIQGEKSSVHLLVLCTTHAIHRLTSKMDLDKP